MQKSGQLKRTTSTKNVNDSSDLPDLIKRTRSDYSDVHLTRTNSTSRKPAFGVGASPLGRQNSFRNGEAVIEKHEDYESQTLLRMKMFIQQQKETNNNKQPIVASS